jgi:hypothetical protein
MATAMASLSPAKQDTVMKDSKHASNEQNIHTPPASDMSSHGRKGDDEDDDGASSSELSDLDDQFEGVPQPSFIQDVPMQDAPAVVEPDRYEGGIPIFQPVRPLNKCLHRTYYEDGCASLPMRFDRRWTDHLLSRPWNNLRTSRST